MREDWDFCKQDEDYSYPYIAVYPVGDIRG